MENVDTPVEENVDTQTETPVNVTEAQPAPKGWKSNLSNDLRGAPFMSKFEDTNEGLGKVVESYANLEKLLGHEKVPIPKDEKDVEGWARYNTAMKVPSKPEGYSLPDAKLPESLKGLVLDKDKFATIMHANHIPPSQANSMWDVYQKENVAIYNQHIESLQKQLDVSINTLRQEWGAAYDTNVQIAQEVINQFAPDKETGEFITASLLKNAGAVKWLKSVGEQFAENKVGEFNIKRFAITPDEAQAEITKLTSDMNGPYFNLKRTHSKAEQDATVKRVTDLRAVVAKAQQGQA